MPVTPDVLILPSELRYFIKVGAAQLDCMRTDLFMPAWVLDLYVFITCEFVKALNKCETSSVGCDWLRVCQPWTTDQRSRGRNLQQAADPAPLLRGRGEGQSLFGRSSGENLIKNFQKLISTGNMFNGEFPYFFNIQLFIQRRITFIRFWQNKQLFWYILVCMVCCFKSNSSGLTTNVWIF